MISELILKNLVNDLMSRDHIHIVIKQMLIIILIDIQVQNACFCVLFLKMGLIFDDIAWWLFFKCLLWKWAAAFVTLLGAFASLCPSLRCAPWPKWIITSWVLTTTLRICDGLSVGGSAWSSLMSTSILQDALAFTTRVCRANLSCCLLHGLMKLFLGCDLSQLFRISFWKNDVNLLLAVALERTSTYWYMLSISLTAFG